MGDFVIEIRSSMSNKLLDRKQVSFEVQHLGGKAATNEEIRSFLKKEYKTSAEAVIVYGVQTVFGGGRTTGFARVYDTPTAAKRIEEKYMLARNGLATNEKKGRKQRKEKKNKAKKLRGKKKADFLYGKKK
ncbi:MAG: 40S ribosomal protein S24 [Amphiamblys sp. WSBS2006]|nr:MAG: 40S ribosomal protein S24 [Amphiamblys sp. WSBS2006]